jgi:hypothetical protein
MRKVKYFKDREEIYEDGKLVKRINYTPELIRKNESIANGTYKKSKKKRSFKKKGLRRSGAVGSGDEFGVG